MARQRNKYPREFKLELLRQIEDGEKTASELCRELGLSPQQVSRWRRQLASKGDVFSVPVMRFWQIRDPEEEDEAHRELVAAYAEFLRDTGGGEDAASPAPQAGTPSDSWRRSVPGPTSGTAEFGSSDPDSHAWFARVRGERPSFQ